MNESRSRNWYSIWSSDRLYSACSTSALKISTSSHGLRPAALLRSASDRRSPPLISAVFSFNRNISNGTAALIATSGSPFASSPS